MSVHNARPGDVYRDASGQLYTVIGYCAEPTVTVERLFTLDEAAEHEGEMTRLSGGVGGLMWNGFTRLDSSDV